MTTKSAVYAHPPHSWEAQGGPAFPSNDGCLPGGSTSFAGMTLRDYFAAKAMEQWFGTGSPDDRARLAYADADAMLRARKEATNG